MTLASVPRYQHLSEEHVVRLSVTVGWLILRKLHHEVHSLLPSEIFFTLCLR